MKIKKYVCTAVLCLAAGLVQAAPASKASVEKLFEVQDFDKMMNDAFNSTTAALLNSEALQQDLAAVPPQKRGQVREIVTRYITQDMQRFNTPEQRVRMRNIAVEATQKVYTQEEVDAMINFYGSPAGRSINAKMPQYFQEVMAPLSNMAAEHVRQSQRQYGHDMAREINQVLCGKDVCKQPARTQPAKPAKPK